MRVAIEDTSAVITNECDYYSVKVKDIDVDIIKGDIIEAIKVVDQISHIDELNDGVIENNIESR